MTTTHPPKVRSPLLLHPGIRVASGVLGVALLVFGVLAVFVPKTAVPGGVGLLVLAAVLLLVAGLGIIPPRLTYKDLTVDLFVLDSLSPEAQVEYLRSLQQRDPGNPVVRDRLQAAEEAVSYEDDALAQLEAISGAVLQREVPVTSEGRGRKLRIDGLLTIDSRRIGIEIRQSGSRAEYRTPVERLLEAMGAGDIEEGLIVTDHPDSYIRGLPAKIAVVRPRDIPTLFAI